MIIFFSIGQKKSSKLYLFYTKNMGPVGLSSAPSLSISTFLSKIDRKTVLKTNLTTLFAKLQKYYITKKGNYISTLKKVLQ